MGIIAGATVGFGLGYQDAKDLLAKLEAMHQDDCPFADRQPSDGQWVRPVLKAEVEYSTQSKPWQLRHAVFQGISP